MDWLVRGGAPPRLEAWSCRRDNIAGGKRPGDRTDHFERAIDREDPGPPALEGPFTRVAAAILEYRVFPAWLIEPVLVRRPVEPGDTVGALCHFLPHLDVFFASRVVERVAVRQGPVWATGFTYRTLEGHPECGEETFVVEKDELTGTITAALRSWSRPGLWYTRVGGPFTRWFQVRANHAALDNLEKVARFGAG